MANLNARLAKLEQEILPKPPELKFEVWEHDAETNTYERTPDFYRPERGPRLTAAEWERRPRDDDGLTRYIVVYGLTGPAPSRDDDDEEDTIEE